MTYRSWLGATALLGLVACATDDVSETTQADTGPFQLQCSTLYEGAGPGSCKTVPPISKPATPEPGADWAPWTVDGAIGHNEYWGATVFPYANPRMKASGGQVMVVNDSNTLHVFLKDLPGVREGSVRIYLDYGRSEGRSAATYALPDGEDRAYDLDLVSGAVTPMRAVTTGGVTSWVPIKMLTLCVPRRGCSNLGWEVDVPAFAAKIGAVHTGVTPRFDAEFSITLRDVPNIVLPQNVPGVGFAVGQLSTNGTRGVGAFPEDLALVPAGGATQHPVETDRTLWQTLLFRAPVGDDVTFATFNIKRFTPVMHTVEQLNSSSALDDSLIASAEIGIYIAQFDVIALEEAWDTDKLDEIVRTANAVRAMRGLGPYHVSDRPHYKDPTIWASLSPLGKEETHGGTYILSRYPFAREGFTTFDRCRGEDCIKTKGVVHARIWFGAPEARSNPNTSPPPSSDAYIDVFATHLNADPEACGASFRDGLSYLQGLVDEGAFCAAFTPLCILRDVALETTFNCLSESNAGVRAAQLAQMNAFIRAETSEDPSRPSIVMGDFNIDGRLQNPARAGEWNMTEYETILNNLELVPPGHSSELPSPDWVNPWRGAYGWPWDIDHADLVRETVPDSTMLYGNGATTGIGATDGAGDHGPRYDYIFVRPGTRPESPAFVGSRWVAAKGSTPCSAMPGCDTSPSPAPVWNAPFPAGSSAVPTVGNRLSDHKPVIANLKLVQMQLPPKFHPSWNHNYRLQVTQASSDDDDCVLGACGGLDLFTNMAKIRYGLGAAGWTEHGATCGDRSAVEWPSDADCMDSWSYVDTHFSGTVTALAGGASLWDADSSSGDDFYSTVPGDRAPIMRMSWGAATVDTWGWTTGIPVPGCPAFHVSEDVPVPCCTRNEGNRLCLETRWTEIAPP